MRPTLAFLLVLLMMFSGHAQTAQPFDMTPERPKDAESPKSTTPAPGSPSAAGKPSAPEPKLNAVDRARRYLVPASSLTLEGEYSRKSWSIFVTGEEAAAATELTLGYQNAVVVAPEASRLTVSINGAELLDVPIASSDRFSEIRTKLPAQLLRPGQNEITIEAVQRHRTDCTMSSTHELWTQVKPAGTFLSFAPSEEALWQHVEDIRAVGVDGEGATAFNLIVPAMDQPLLTEPMIRLGQSLALMANMPNQSFVVAGEATGSTKPGSANVLVGTASELSGIVGELPLSAQSGPIAAFVQDPKLGPTMLISGPSWQAVNTAIDGLAHQVDRPVGLQRLTLSTQSWRLPDVPLLHGDISLTFAQLGIATMEFSGRRLRTDFAVGVPSDFYANAYGEATIMLDAAYSEEVLPGSHIDVYVNDNIAATVPITTSGGEILRHLPIKVTMRHFRPGDNTIALEALLNTPSDMVCAPGATALTKARFVLFDSSEFVMPNFARIGETPNLAATSGTAFPYSLVEYPLPLIVDRTQPEALSAAVTFMARMATSAGRLIPVDTSTSAAALTDRNAIFVSAVGEVPAPVLAQLGVSATSQTGWQETVASIGPNTDATFDEWRERLRGRGWRGRVSLLEDWINRTFNVSTDSFRLFKRAPAPFEPSAHDGLLIAQESSPIGEGIWTLVTAPDTASLREGVDSIANRSTWRGLGGRITTLDIVDTKLKTVPISGFSFVETQPFSLSNYRLVAANWLSANAPAYSLGLAVLSIFLGLATAGLLRALGKGQ